MSERNPKDYAIEHAAYMADSAERLLNALGEPEQDNLNVAVCATQLRTRVYEFRKRVFAIVAPHTSGPGPHGVFTIDEYREASKE